MWRYITFPLLLALAACGDAGPAALPAGEPEGPEPEAAYLARDLHDEDLGVRVRAAEVLATLGPDAAPAVPDLLALARDADPRLREPAERAIRGAGEAAIPPLLEALAGEDWRDRAPAVKALAELGKPAKEAVVALLEDPARRAGALEFLEQARLPEGFDPACLLPLLEDPEPAVRLAAVRLAWRSHGTRETLLVYRAALRDENPAVRGVAIDALKSAGKWAAAAGPDLREAIGRGDYRAVEALERVEGTVDEETLDALAAQIRESADSPAVALRALRQGAGRSARYVSLFAECLGRADAAVRIEAVEALSRIGPRAAPAVPALRESLLRVPASAAGSADEGRFLRTAADLLFRLDAEIPPATLPALLVASPHARYLDDLVARPGADAAVPVLVELLRTDRADPFRVLELLRKIGTDAKPLLREALRDATGSGRLGLLYVLRRSGGDAHDLEAALAAALGDQNAVGRRTEEIVLGLAADDPSAPGLRDLLVAVLREGQAESEKVVRLLSKAGVDPRPLLRSALPGAEGARRIDLLASLAHLGEKEQEDAFREAVLAALASDDRPARERAIRCVAESRAPYPEAAPLLVSRLADADGMERMLVFVALRTIGKPALPALEEYVRSHPEGRARKWAENLATEIREE